MATDVTVMIGGEAGQGVQSMGAILARTLAGAGYQVFGDQDYESRIRGGHNFFRIRVKDSDVGAVSESVDVLIALNKETIDLHRRELSPRGVVLYDGEQISDVGRDGTMLSVPLGRLAEESGGSKIVANSVALGATAGLMNYNVEILAHILTGFFGGDGVGESNARAARAGYGYAKENLERDFGLAPEGGRQAKGLVVTGNEALSLGAMVAGCTFYAGYPMTPASSIMEFLAAKAKDYGMVVLQTEDEIAAINCVVGAGYAGARAMTATSGSGFCLMVEGLGLAGLTETPVVMVDAQRPGPAVGMPTRTEQGDLEFVIHAHHGDFPRAVLAPATVEDCFWLTAKAFNLADMYQIPVILLTDHHLATSVATVERFDLSKVAIDRGELVDSAGDDYVRHRVTESGVSPRALPGMGRGLVMTDSDEHDEAGHMTESAQVRTDQADKRLQKLEGLRKQIGSPRRFGPDKAETTLVGWGSTYGALKEAVELLQADGLDVNLLHLSELWPFPAGQVAATLDKARQSYVVEGNATGQLAHLIRAETGRDVSGKILRYDGRPFSPAFIAARIRAEAQRW
ncbi:MAG: 2-oxoacid:acceptor oxidoreductase subunit alpha [Chloroflexota bacterium]